jgi:ribosomal protein S18 acetylase RimI-like enzyme
MEALTVRPATRADLPAVARLAALLVRLHHAFDPARFLCLEPLEPGYARFLGGELDDDDAVILVAVTRDPASSDEAERVIGYTYGRLEPRDWNELLDACGKIHDVYVDEAARGRGAAKALVEAMVERLESKGAPRVVLLSATPNVAAQRLFAKLGFRPTMVEMTREKKP